MSGPVFVFYLLLWATLMRALLVKARILPPTCARCGLRYERQALGEAICSCHS
ncbi:MAG TPA: hypothetical protein VFA56_00735 [Gaiellaceae bacterium]|nr:hypothetical protein [Gaiellaceae bacterium]